ncbi:MAG: hypothetical protein JWN70_3904 [Planctomycetaceae bacterium]|nr:hypothetical protein [Planctomycetaceae bacterium]
MYRARAQELLVVMTLVLSGCGEQADHWKDARPETAPASGMVTFDGEPLEGAVVVFQPTAPDGIGASALTDGEGKFELRTFPPELGAVPGKYAVSIMKTEMPKRPSSSAGNVDDPEPIHVVSVIPQKYAIPTQSDLSAEIPESGTDTLDFELKK